MLVRYQVQPQGRERIDSGTVLGNALSSVYLPGIDRASQTGAWDRKGSTQLAVAGGTQTRAYANQGVFYSDNGGGYITGPIPSISTFPIVLVAAGYFNSGADSWNFMSLNTSGGAGSSRCEISLASSTEIDYVLRNNFGTVATTQGSGLSGVSSGTFFCCVAQSRSATDHNLYINGTQYTSATNMGGITSAYNALTIGGTSAGGTPTAKLNGGVLFAGYGRTALSDNLALEVSRSPRPFWQMFSRQGKRYLAMAPAAAGGFFSRYYYDMGSVNSV